jgi:multicomponent Na+:H+ antiporter subunit E
MPTLSSQDNRGKMAKSILWLGAIILTWLIFSAHLTIINVAVGIIMGIIVLVMKRQLFSRYSDKSNLPLQALWRIPIYVLWLIKEIILSGTRVGLMVWRRKLPIAPDLFWIPCHMERENFMTLYANSITLTPGTIAIMVKKNKMLVHALSAMDSKSLQEQAMEKQILSIFKA